MLCKRDGSCRGPFIRVVQGYHSRAGLAGTGDCSLPLTYSEMAAKKVPQPPSSKDFQSQYLLRPPRSHLRPTPQTHVPTTHPPPAPTTTNHRHHTPYNTLPRPVTSFCSFLPRSFQSRTGRSSCR